MFAKNKNHRSFIILSFISLAFLMNLGVSFAQSTPTVELTIHASDGFWSVYAADSTGNNAGIEDYDLDVVASGGISLLSCRNQTPTGTDDIGAADGFGLLTSNGNVSGGSVLGITGAQAAIYDSSTNNLVEDQAVIQGFGQVASSSLMNNPWNVSWSQPALIASGSYEGISGSLTVKSDPTAITGFQCLDIVQNGQWAGPGNVENANVISASAQIEQSEHAHLHADLLGGRRRGRAIGQGSIRAGSEAVQLCYLHRIQSRPGWVSALYGHCDRRHGGCAGQTGA